jgi:hypothetical protein
VVSAGRNQSGRRSGGVGKDTSFPDALKSCQTAAATLAAVVAPVDRPPADAQQEAAAVEALPEPVLAPAPRDGCSEGCLNRLSFVHCDGATCPCADRCANRPFHLLPLPPMEVFLTSDKGWGVRAAAPIPRGTFVCEYAGEVIDDAEVARRVEDARQKREPHFYMMEMGPGLVIDARDKGNIARLLNSSCDPNCETQKWHDAATGEVRVGLFTIRDVAPGEEMMYDYHFQHFGVAEAATAGEYTCRCGAPRCRGTMVHKDREVSRDLHRRVDIWWEGDACFYRGTVIGYSVATGRHAVLYDDGEVEKVVLAESGFMWVDGEEVGKKDTQRNNAGGTPVRPVSVKKVESPVRQVVDQEMVPPAQVNTETYAPPPLPHFPGHTDNF